jgi:hypothetical protein
MMQETSGGRQEQRRPAIAGRPIRRPGRVCARPPGRARHRSFPAQGLHPRRLVLLQAPPAVARSSPVRPAPPPERSGRSRAVSNRPARPDRQQPRARRTNTPLHGMMPGCWDWCPPSNGNGAPDTKTGTQEIGKSLFRWVFDVHFAPPCRSLPAIHAVSKSGHRMRIRRPISNGRGGKPSCEKHVEFLD